MYFSKLGHVVEGSQSLHICSIPVSGLAALVYVGNLSQSSHRVSTCCVNNLLVKYGLNLGCICTDQGIKLIVT